MSRNPVIPFVIIMVFGIVLIFGLSFKGLGDSKTTAKNNGGTTTSQTQSQPQSTSAAFDPQAFYKTTCIGCHGDQYQGVVGPSLKGIGSKLTVAQIKQIITHGKGGMPPNLVPADKADAMAKWVSQIK
jgi:cytochrome c550